MFSVRIVHKRSHTILHDVSELIWLRSDVAPDCCLRKQVAQLVSVSHHERSACFLLYGALYSRNGSQRWDSRILAMEICPAGQVVACCVQVTVRERQCASQDVALEHLEQSLRVQLLRAQILVPFPQGSSMHLGQYWQHKFTGQN